MSLNGQIGLLKDGERLISLRQIARLWSADTRTVETALRKRGIPIFALTPRKRGIAPAHYRTLLESTLTGGETMRMPDIGR